MFCRFAAIIAQFHFPTGNKIRRLTLRLLHKLFLVTKTIKIHFFNKLKIFLSQLVILLHAV